MRAKHSIGLDDCRRLFLDIHCRTDVGYSVMRPTAALQMASLPAWNSNGSPSRPIYFGGAMTVKTPLDSPGELPSPISPGTPVTPVNGVTSPGLLKKKPRIRRKRCNVCEGCLRQEDCGTCTVCRNSNRTNSKCKMRRCKLLTQRPPLVRLPTT